MGTAAILFSGAIINTPSTEGLRWNLVKIGRAVAERLHNFIHVYSPGTRADNPARVKILNVTENVLSYIVSNSD